MAGRWWRAADGTAYFGTREYGLPYARMIFPGVSLKAGGAVSRNGLNIWAPREWRHSSRGFIFRIGRLQYYFRWSVPQRRLIHGWEWRCGD